MLCSASLALSLVQAAPGPALEPKLDEVRLVIDGGELAPVEAHAGRAPSRAFGAHRIRIDGRGIRSTGFGGEAEWTAEAPDGKELAWLASAGGVLVLGEVDGSSTVHRLDLASGAWLDPVETDPDGDRTVVDSAVADGDAVVLYSTRRRAEDRAAARTDLGAYRVQRLDPVGGAILWTVDRASEDARPGRYAALWSPGRPRLERDRTEHLTATDAGLLVCAGGANDPLVLDRGTGAVLGRIDHPWEVQRAFAGDDALAVMARFGDPTLVAGGWANDTVAQADADERVAAGRRAFEERWHGSILAGPAIVTATEGWHRGPEHTFLAIARDPVDSPVPGGLVEPSVLELDSTGRPLTIVPVPRAPQPGRWTVHRGTIVWACAGGAFACFRPALSTDDLARGDLGDERIGHLRWYRALEPGEPRAWLSTDAAADAVAFGAEVALRPAGGGLVLAQSRPVFEFPLWRVALDDGAADEITLRVPFRGELERPRSGTVGGGEGVHVLGPYGLGLTELAIDGNRLSVQLASSAGTWGLEFELP